MARRRRIVLVLCACVAMGLVDCSPPPVTQRCVPDQSGIFGGGFGTGGGAGSEPIFFAGAPAEFVLESFASTTCEPTWSIEGDVIDPQNLAVPAEFTRVEGVGRTANARVRFTPSAPGSYLVTARFEPSIARVQRVVQVARDRTAEAPIIDALPFDLSRCVAAFRTLRGAVVCQRSGTTDVVREAGLLESFPGAAASVVGNTVWLLTPRRVERRVDTGVGPLQLTGFLVAKDQLSMNGSFFDDDRAIVVDGAFPRGPLVLGDAGLVDEALSFGLGSGLLLGARALSFDGLRVCDVVPDGGGCASLMPVGVEADVLWTWEGQSLSYRTGLTSPATLLPIALGASSLVDVLAFPVSGAQTPRVRMANGQLFTATRAPGGVVLERWPSTTRFSRDFGLVESTATSAKWLRR
ncbi:MAG: hypothetical protein Q8L14_33095 [Myxococcales bacterium]|nr:hypothetical protein [Myxococcales bacterium]